MKKFYFIVVMLVLVCWSSNICFGLTVPTEWQTLAPGLSYTQVYPSPGFPFGAVHAFKINLSYYHLQLAFTKNTKQRLILVKDLVTYNNALLGINGGFFNPNIEPLGLRIKDGKQFSSIKHISWWGIFYIKNNRPYIVSQNQYQPNKQVRFAIQSGPRLVVNRKIPSLKGGWSFRSALGITSDGSIIIAITDRLPLTTKTFAEILSTPETKGGLNCIDALNLDGGSSSQLYAQLGTFYLNIPSLVPVSDVVLVLPNS